MQQFNYVPFERGSGTSRVMPPEDLPHQILQAKEHLDAWVSLLSARRSGAFALPAAKAKVESLLRDLALQRRAAEEARERVEALERVAGERSREADHLRAEAVRTASELRVASEEMRLVAAAYGAAVRAGRLLAQEREALKHLLCVSDGALRLATDEAAHLQETVAELTAELQALLSQDAQLLSVEALSEATEVFDYAGLGADLEAEEADARHVEEVARLEGRIKALEDALRSAGEREAALLERVESARTERTQLSISLAEAWAEAGGHKQSADRYESSIRAVETERNVLKQMQEQADNEKHVLRERVEALESRNAEDQRRLSALRAENAAAAEALDAARREIASLRETYHALERDSGAVADARRQIARLEGELEALRQRDAEWDGVRGELQAQLQALRAEKVAASLTVEEARAENAALRQTMEATAGRMAAREVEVFKQQLARMRHQLEEARVQEGALIAEQTERMASWEAAKAEVVEARKEIRGLRETLTEREHALVRQAAEYKQLRNQMAQLGALVDAMRAEGDQHETVISSIRSERDAEADRCRALEQELKEAQARLEASPAPETLGELERLQAENAALLATLRERDTGPLPFCAFDEMGRRRQLGEILREAKVITGEQLHAALEEQQRGRQRHLGELLVGMGFLTEPALAQALASQLRLPFVRVSRDVVSAAAVRLISPRLAAKHECIPMRATHSRLVLAMVNPLDLVAVEDVELATLLEVEPVVAMASDIRQTIQDVYGNVIAAG